MKKTILFLIILGAISITGCSKEEEAMIDCLGQSALLDVHHTTASDNPNARNFNIEYFGDLTLNNTVKWNFGDGTPAQNLPGTTVSHTYTQPGTYTATAHIKLNRGKCSYDINETVVIE